VAVCIKGKRAKSLIAEGAKLIDTRGAVSFRDGTLPNATNVQLRRVSELFKLPKDTKIILFGTGYDDTNVISAASYLSQYGFFNVYSLGSMKEWDL